MPEVQSSEDLLEQLIKLTALQVKLAVGNQTQTILELQKLGFATSRIGEVLGTTANTVNVTIQKNKKRKSRGGREEQGEPEDDN